MHPNNCYHQQGALCSGFSFSIISPIFHQTVVVMNFCSSCSCCHLYNCSLFVTYPSGFNPYANSSSHSLLVVFTPCFAQRSSSGWVCSLVSVLLSVGASEGLVCSYLAQFFPVLAGYCFKKILVWQVIKNLWVITVDYA